MVRAVGELDERERVLRRHRIARDLGDEGDILPRSEARDEVVELEHEADTVAAEARELGLVRAGEIAPAIRERAIGGHVEAAEIVEQRGLAASRCAEEDDEFAGVKIEVDAIERAHFHLAAGVDLCDAARGEERLAGRLRAGPRWRFGEHWQVGRGAFHRRKSAHHGGDGNLIKAC